MEIIDRSGNRRTVNDALYAQGLKGWKALSEELGVDGAKEVYAQLGVSGEQDLTEAGQKEIKKDVRRARESGVDFAGAMEAAAAGGDAKDVAAAADRSKSGQDDGEVESIFSQYEVGDDGKVRTRKEAEIYKKDAPRREAERARRRMVVGNGVCFAAYRAYKWHPPAGLMLNDKGEIVPDAPLETEPNTKYRMADPNDPEEAAYVKTTEDGKTLYRIQALRDITLADGTVVKAGEWGGWIESEDNLAFGDDSWVKDEAVVCEAARVSGDALVKDEATAGGCARVTEGAVVSDTAVVDERAIVKDGAEVKDETVVAGYGTVESAVVEGSSVVTGVAEVANIQVEDVHAGDPADAEKKLQEEAAMTPEDAVKRGVAAKEDLVYGDVSNLDMQAYDHGDGNGVPQAPGPFDGFLPPKPTEPEAAPETRPVEAKPDAKPAEPAPGTKPVEAGPEAKPATRRDPGYRTAAPSGASYAGYGYGM